MLRSFFVLMTLIITMNASMAASHAGVKAALDEFSYAMNVEGAALDPASAEATIADFSERLRELNQQGVSQEEIVDTALSEVVDAKTAEELKGAFAHIKAEKLTPEEANNLIQGIVSRNYQTGASWHPVGEFFKGVGILVLMMAFMFGLMYVVVRSSDCPANYTEEQCKQWDENVKW